MLLRATALLLSVFAVSLISAQSAQPPAGDKGSGEKGIVKKDPYKVPADPNLQIGGKGPEYYAREARTSQDPSIREGSFRTLAAFGPAARKYAGEAIIWGLTKDPDPTIRVAALHAAQSVGLEEERDIETAHKAAVDMLSSQQLQVRFEAANAIALVGNKVRKIALPKLYAMVTESNSWQLRKAAVVAIGKIGFDDEKGMPDSVALNALLKACHDSSYVVRKEAVQGIILIGRATKLLDIQSVQSAMANLKNDKDSGVAIWARVALVWYDAEKLKSSYPPLLELIAKLRDSNAAVRYEAYNGLGTIGKAVGIKSKEILEAAEGEKEDLVLATAIWCLGNCGAAAEVAVPFLERQVRGHPNAEIQQGARDSVAAILKDKSATPPDPKKKDPKK